MVKWLMNYYIIEPRSVGAYLCADYKIACKQPWENETLKYSLTRLILRIAYTVLILYATHIYIILGLV